MGLAVATHASPCLDPFDSLSSDFWRDPSQIEDRRKGFLRSEPALSEAEWIGMTGMRDHITNIDRSE